MDRFDKFSDGGKVSLFLELVHDLQNLFVCALLFLSGRKVCATSRLDSFGTPRTVFIHLLIIKELSCQNSGS